MTYSCRANHCVGMVSLCYANLRLRKVELKEGQ